MNSATLSSATASTPSWPFQRPNVFPDEQSFQRLDFRRRPVDEEEADAKALELLKNSPYKEKLANVGLFLKALQQRAPELPSLIRPHLGNSLAAGASIRMSVLLATAPPLDEHRIESDRRASLGRTVKVNPWTDRVELSKARPCDFRIGPRETALEITPFFPYLTRCASDDEKVALLVLEQSDQRTSGRLNAGHLPSTHRRHSPYLAIELSLLFI